MFYNVTAVSTRTGVPASTLRTWERRYGVPRPQRGSRGRRMYSEADLELVGEMAALLERGITASLAAEAVRARNRPDVDMALLVTLSRVALHFPNGSINIFDRDLRYVFAEGLGLRSVGLSSDALVGKTIYELFPPEYISPVESQYRQAFRGESVVFELDAFGRRYSLAAGPLEVTDEGVATILVVAQDISAWLT